ncbi:MAG: hypothetical protein PVSMB4_03340 [Ktedonobacterales bacterium]
MRPLMWPRGGWGRLALVCGLVAIILAVSLAATTRTPHTFTGQFFLTRDFARPATVRIVIKSVSLQPLSVSSQSCDGVAFRRGFPDQALYVGIGWYVDVPARPFGQRYSCTFKDAFATRALAIPASNVSAIPITAPAPHTALSRATPLTVAFASCDEFPPPSEAVMTDAAGHSALARQLSCGPHGGWVNFAPARSADFDAGPGTIALHTEFMVSAVQCGQGCGVTFIDDATTSVPVIWT